MSILKSIGKLAAAGVVAAGMFATSTATRAAETIPILLCPFGCGPMAGDTILMNQLIKSGSDVILLPQETPGYMYNIREMGRSKRKWKSSIFKTEDVLIQIAYAGGSKEMKEFIPEPVKIPWKILYGETWWGQGKFLGTFNLRSQEDVRPEGQAHFAWFARSVRTGASFRASSWNMSSRSRPTTLTSVT